MGYVLAPAAKGMAWKKSSGIFVGVPRSRLLNLRICEGDGKAPDEEYWLELEDESLAYQLGERIPALSNEALQQLLTQSNQRSSAPGELGA